MLKSLRTTNAVDLFWVLFRTNFKLKYNDSVLGFLWVLFRPFSLFLVLYYVLTSIFSNQIEHYGIYLLMGNIFFTFWSDSTNQGLESLLSRANLVLKINFPKYITLFSSTAISLVNFLISSAILFVFALLEGIQLSFVSIFLYFVSGFLLYFVAVTTSMYTSVIYMRFRDLKQIWELISNIMFWLTPVFYSPESIINKVMFAEQIIYWINPVSVTLISARSAIIDGKIEYIPNLLALILFSVVFFIFGYILYKTLIKRIAEFV